jgi:hypothetical protein
MNRFRATLLLVVGGALVGAAATTTMLVAIFAAAGANVFTGEYLAEFAKYGGMVGAPAGAVFAPLGGWALLRRVPLWKAAVVTSLGTIIGGVVGGFILPAAHGPGLLGMVIGTATGFLIAAGHLARTHRLPASDKHAT